MEFNKETFEKALKANKIVRYHQHFEAVVQSYLEIENQALRQQPVSGSLHLVDFIKEIEYMQGLYSNARYTQAEATRDKLADQLDDLMRLGQQ